MRDKTLSAAEWHMLFALPADGQVHHVQGVSARVIHKPATAIQVEQVIAETRFGTLRRRLVNGKWQATEYLNGVAQ